MNLVLPASLTDYELLGASVRGAGHINKLRVEEADPYYWILLEDLVYVTMLYGDPYSLVSVPAGFRTDLASIPRPLQGIVPVNGRHRPSAVVHDWLTKRNPDFNQKGQDGIDRRTADKVFYESMDLRGVPVVRRYAMLGAVRAYSFFQRG